MRTKRQSKPPLGVQPKWLHDELRFKDLSGAISRYAESKLPIPIEWVEEREQLRKTIFKQ